MKKDNSTLILLVLAGLGIYWYMRNKNKPVEKDNTVAPDISNYPTAKPTSDINFTFSINGYKKRLGNVPNTI
jgi:hypothetical protein